MSGSRRLDFGAMGLTLAITLLLIWGIKETKTANNSAHRRCRRWFYNKLTRCLLLVVCSRLQNQYVHCVHR